MVDKGLERGEEGPYVKNKRPVAQMAFAGYLVKNPINWRVMTLDIIGVLGNAISQR
jgi:hypothetical protein